MNPPRLACQTGQHGRDDSEAAQSTAGGWIYTPNSNDDEGSVTVTQIATMTTP